MKQVILIVISVFSMNTYMDEGILFERTRNIGKPEITDSLPSVFANDHNDLVLSDLRNEAFLRFAQHKLPDNIIDWDNYRVSLRNEIIKKTGVIIDHNLQLNIREFLTIQLKGYSIRNIAFQTLPGVYATANLFIPEGKGPFPAIINVHAHSGRFDDKDQAVAHSLALNGFVCLSIDPWGAGERTTIHGVTEYHGANLGASVMNIGESLMGLQISDNMRGVDLLCSLPYVDANNIGATGASGGGNQTMWLAAVDERIKAAVPVVSVGTFESYVMRSNCICELLIDGLTFTEEAGVLALSRAIMPCNHNQDESPTFFSSEMFRSYKNARKIFALKGEEDHISFCMFDLDHGYLIEDREAMLGWFDLHLKNIGTGIAKKEIPFELLTEAELMVYPKGKRDQDITTTEEYCKKKGIELRKVYLSTNSFNIDQKKKELSAVLRINEKPELKQVHQYATKNGWNRFALETTDQKLIPVLLYPPVDNSHGFVILCDPDGKYSIPSSTINEYRKKGTGIAIVDLTGTGETSSPLDTSADRRFVLHTLSRAELWLGKTVLGEWAKDLNIVADFLDSSYKPIEISIDGNREAGLAGLFLNSLEGDIDNIILRDAPVSYLFDSREAIDFYSMAIHLPGFLKWGDISLAAALCGKNVTFINPKTMSGQTIEGTRKKEYEAEYDILRKKCSQAGKISF